MLLANSKRPLAFAKLSRATKAGTRDGALTLKPTVPTAAKNPTTANKVTLILIGQQGCNQNHQSKDPQDL